MGTWTVAAGNWALKEWAVIVHALLEGEQILDVRKGGIREDGRHFSVQANRLWLYPTAEHQKPELLKAAVPALDRPRERGARRRAHHARGLGRRRRASRPSPSQEELDAIASKLIWTADYAASRLGWKHRDPLWVLALRVHRLDEPVTVAWADELRRLHLVGGARRPAGRSRRRCRSQPALSDVAFDARLKGAVEALPSLADAGA